jgi:hypothetical protein
MWTLLDYSVEALGCVCNFIAESVHLAQLPTN